MKSTTAALKSKDEIRLAAVAFSADHAYDTSEAAERQTFWNDFFAIFGLSRKRVASFEKLANRASTGSHGFIDLLHPGQMAVEHKSAGEDLHKAMDQLVDYLDGLTEAELPWLLVACDFQRFKWHNLETDESGQFELSRLVDNLDLFYWLAGGYERPGVQYQTEEAANLAATALLADLHDRMLQNGYGAHELREWLTRILFCLFADDTGVWDRGAFHSWIVGHTTQDGSDLGALLQQLFQVLNTTPHDRSPALSGELAEFTFVNGDLFEQTLTIPTCDEAVREALLKASKFDWSVLSPAIFGSMFQNVMQPRERRQLGAHYTTEENILRTIRPLFLDQLEDDLARATTKPKLEAFLDRLSNLTFMDPACGCGNFLVITYRELRRLETEAVRALRKKQGQSGQLEVDVTMRFRVTVDQFYGIEIEEFPAKIARTAMYLIDHLANREVSAEFGQHFVRFPIPSAPNIVHADALEIDWADVLSPTEADFVYGNPPFAGHRYRTEYQSDQMRKVFGKSYLKTLDYVTCWYRIALDYGRNEDVRFAFVSTNSMAQGEPVEPLFKPLLDKGFVIDFAYQTFPWTSEAGGAANVSVVIVGFSHGKPAMPNLLINVNTDGSVTTTTAKNISPYLVEGPPLCVERRTEPLSPAMPEVNYGSLPNDGGGLVVTPGEEPPASDPATKYLREYVGSKELLHGDRRWILWMPDGPDPSDLKQSPFLKQRLAAVRAARLASRNPDAQALANTPYRFFHNAQPMTKYLGIPAQSSETRVWYPVDYLTPDVIASNTLYVAPDPDGFLFGVVSSSWLRAWLAGIGGQLETRLRYAKKIVHNTFPLPVEVSSTHREAVINAGKAVLAARPAGMSLAEMYDPLGMAPGLVKAHKHLDKAVAKALQVSRRKAHTDALRLTVLLELYEEMLPKLVV